MSKVSEASYTKKVTAFLKTLEKCWFFKVWGGGMQKRGIPDIVGIKNGRFFALELKASDGAASELQKRNVRLINECGGYAKVSWPDDWQKTRRELLKL